MQGCETRPHVQALLKAGADDRDDWLKVMSQAASGLGGRLDMQAVICGMPSVSAVVMASCD